MMIDEAIIVENSEVINIAETATKVAAVSNSVKCMYSLSPKKILIVFECKNDATYVVSVDSPLWNVFDDVRM